MTQWQRITHDLIDRFRVTAGDLGLVTLRHEAEEWLRQEPAEIASQPEAPAYPGPRCAAHDAALANLGFFKCGCRYITPEAPLRERQAQACESVGFGQLADALRSQPAAPGCCPFVRSGGFHGEDCADQGRGVCTTDIGQTTAAGRASQPETPKGPADEAEDTESLIEQLDEALCSLLHQGDEVGTHAPREHLDLFYARQASGTLYLASVQGLRDSLAAANARIVTLDRGLGDEIRAHHETRVRELAANARIVDLTEQLRLSRGSK